MRILIILRIPKVLVSIVSPLIIFVDIAKYCTSSNLIQQLRCYNYCLLFKFKTMQKLIMIKETANMDNSRATCSLADFQCLPSEHYKIIEHLITDYVLILSTVQ